MEMEGSIGEGKSPIVICVTGAAGQIAYSLLFSLAQGDIFGQDQPLKLQLLDIAPMQNCVAGVVMELQDCSFPLIADIMHTSDADEAFRDCDVAILVGAMPRREGMERGDLLAKNGKIFMAQGDSLDRVAKKSVKVLVVGNPANTNALIASRFAPSIPSSQFTALTQLDQNRATAQIAMKLGVKPNRVKNIVIWGNHSTTQYPDVSHAYVEMPDGGRTPVLDLIDDEAYIRGTFVSTVQARGKEVIMARKLSSAMSAAKAIGDHMHHWWFGTPEGEFTSMGIVSKGAYGISRDIVYSMPVTVKDGVITPHEKLQLDDFSKQLMEKTQQELLAERDSALQLVGN
eukprot:m.21098 g.21098  ORF g.21098 m.21098 type:complete len:343 (+) comp7031_c0_seq1:422-1450(+)